MASPKSTDIERRFPVYTLLAHKVTLKQLNSFSECVDRINFTTYQGWGGKTYVSPEGHGVEEYKPSLRGVEILDVHYLKLTDTVMLTENQYRDYRVIADGRAAM